MAEHDRELYTSEEKLAVMTIGRWIVFAFLRLEKQQHTMDPSRSLNCSEVG